LVAADGPLRAAALELAEMDVEWISVGLWRYEFGNVLWKLVRAGVVESEGVSLLWDRAEQVIAETVERVEVKGIQEIAVRCGLTFYDASYVWLARSRTLELRTRDRQILRECRDVARAMPEP